ncbi:MAG: hypothetical protein JW829_06295 [Pirellulales bacterium]|nr:hypothetical protein [Pirellulales bacterium]
MKSLLRCFLPLIIAGYCTIAIQLAGCHLAMAGIVSGQWLQLNFTDGWYAGDNDTHNWNYFVTNNSGFNSTTGNDTDMIDSMGNPVTGVTLTGAGWEGRNWTGGQLWPGDEIETAGPKPDGGFWLMRRPESINFWWGLGGETVTVSGLDPSLVYNAKVYSMHPASGPGTGELTTVTLNGISIGPYYRGDRWAMTTTPYIYEAIHTTGPDNSLEFTFTSPNPTVNAIVIVAIPQEILSIEVNTTTGQVALMNASAADLDIKGYSIDSMAGSLNPAGWSSLQENPGFGNGDPADGIGWEQLGAGLSTRVGEYNLQGSSIFGPGGTVSVGLGGLFTPGSAEDLSFQFTTTDGLIREGLIEYVTSGDIADFNSDGDVDGADFLTWQKGFGIMGTATLADGDANGDKNVDSSDLAIWKSQFGMVGSSHGLAFVAVPEPETAGLVGMLLLTLAIGFFGSITRQHPMRSIICWMAFGIPMMLLVKTVSASSTPDRLYLLGDDDAVASAGEIIWSTDDSYVVDPGFGDQQNLESLTGIVTYIDVSTIGSGRPGAMEGDLGANFTGTTDSFLTGERLGYPATSAASTGAVPEGPLDYTGIWSRGLQFWVYPKSPGGTVQDIVMDTDQHGVRISAAGNWVMFYGGAYESSTTVTSNTWHHVLVVDSNAPGAYDDAYLFVDGVAVMAASGSYNGGSDLPLVLGASTGETPGTSNFFNGVIDDLEMFVMGTSNGDPFEVPPVLPTNYGVFNAGEDNDFIAAQELVPGDLTGDRLVQGDGSGGMAEHDDVGVFIQHWRERNLVNGVQVGDLFSRGMGDFDFDGFVELTDWHILRTHHANGASLDLGELLAGAGVPEPSSIWLLSAFLIAMGCWRTTCRRGLVPCWLRYSVLAACAILVWSGSSNAFEMWNVDFQGDIVDTAGNPATTYGQTAIADNHGPDVYGIWNPFLVSGFSATPQVNFSTNPSMSLVDKYGTPSSVTVTLIGDYAGWNGDSSADSLIGDYIILLSEGTLGWPSPPLSMTVSGLVPNTVYNLRLYSAENTARDMNMLVDTNGDGSLADEVEVLGPGGGVATDFIFTSSASGEMIAEVDLASVIESNLSGMQIARNAFAPVLTIDRSTGQMTLSNNTGESVTMAAYAIDSNSVGALDPSQWLSIADHYDSNNGGSVDPTMTWIEFTRSSDRDNLSEGQQPGGTGAILAHNQSIDLGSSWIRNPTEDISMRLLLNDGSIHLVEVKYDGNVVKPGDYDYDGDIDVADWNLFKPGFLVDTSHLSLAEAYGFGDLSGDGLIDLFDVNAFAQFFDAENGSGAFASMIAVPEPGSALLLFGALIGCIISVFHRHRR